MKREPVNPELYALIRPGTDRAVDEAMQPKLERMKRRLARKAKELVDDMGDA